MKLHTRTHTRTHTCIDQGLAFQHKAHGPHDPSWAFNTALAFPLTSTDSGAYVHF